MQTLAGENTVHDGDVLVRGVGRAAHGDNQDARLEAFHAGAVSTAVIIAAAAVTAGSGCRGWIGGVCTAMGFFPGDCATVDVAQGQGQGASHHGGRGCFDVRAGCRIQQVA